MANLVDFPSYIFECEFIARAETMFFYKAQSYYENNAHCYQYRNTLIGALNKFIKHRQPHPLQIWSSSVEIFRT